MGVQHTAKEAIPVLRRELNGAHDHVDAAIEQGATLLAAAMRMRRAHFCGTLAQAEVATLVAGIVQLNDVRDGFIRAHQGFTQLAITTGLVRSEGDIPGKGQPMIAEPHLQVVAA